jgi:hypothetical protein
MTVGAPSKLRLGGLFFHVLRMRSPGHAVLWTTIPRKPLRRFYLPIPRPSRAWTGTLESLIEFPLVA